MGSRKGAGKVLRIDPFQDYILKVEPTGVIDRFDEGYESKGVKYVLEDFSQNYKHGVVTTELTSVKWRRIFEHLYVLASAWGKEGN